MCKFKSRTFVYNAMFFVVVVLAAMASAVLEVSAVFGGWPSIDAVPMAQSSTAPAAANGPALAVSSVDGAPVSVATVAH